MDFKNQTNTIESIVDLSTIKIMKEVTPKDAVDAIPKDFPSVSHGNILPSLLYEIKPIDFRKKAGFTDDKEKLEKKHYLIICIEEILDVAKSRNWGLCKRNGFLYVYNGAFWQQVSKEDLENFLGNAAEKMGIEKHEARFYGFKEQLLKQFLSSATLPDMNESNDAVLINLLNGTFEISTEKQELRVASRKDFITYQLPFEYNASASAPIFQAYLDKVLPDTACQKVLAEYLSYVFFKAGKLKLEKALILFGSGANGKSVLFDIVNALLGSHNVSNYSLYNLTNDNGYYRAKIGNKLLNYASEINNKLSTDVFKQLVSNEPVEARLPYGEPFTMTNYAKLLFNCNELPKDIEQTNAFFRRFLIIPFNVTIPEDEQDKELAKKIIDNELSGVFNWVMEGLNRLLTQKDFTPSDIIKNQVEEYKLQSDSVKLFLFDENYEVSAANKIYLKDLYTEYKEYCKFNGYMTCSAKTVSERLKKIGYKLTRQNQGQVVYIEKKVVLEATHSTQPTLYGQCG